jgi:hypothetical protein
MASAYYYGEGNGVISTTEDSNENAIVTEYGVGESLVQKTVLRGSAFYSTPSTGKLSFLNNFLGVFETKVDNVSGDGNEKVWECNSLQEFSIITINILHVR